MGEPGRGAARAAGWTIDEGFDLDGFLAQPLVARVAAVGRSGPGVRPLWYLWEEPAFWWLTGGCFVVLQPTVLRARDLSY